MQEKAFFSQVLPSLKHLRRLCVQMGYRTAARSKTDVIKKTHALCPSLWVIHIQDPIEVRQPVYDWEERSMSWVLSHYRDIWAEAVREIDVCVYRLVKHHFLC
jgi:hypothetical protein